VSWDKGQAVNLTRFDGYWDTSRARKVKDISFRVVSDADTLASAVLGGDIQGTFDLNGKAVQPLQRQVNVFRGPSMDVRLVGYNTTKAPFDDPRVRQALSHAIDKQGLLASAYGNEGQLWDSPMVAQQWVFSKSIFKKAYDALPDFNYDLDKAKSLIAEANPSVKTGNIIAATPEQSAQALAVQNAADQLGLNLSIDKVPGDRAIQMIYSDKPRTYSMVMYDWGADVPDPAANLQFPFWSKNPINNFTNYKNPEVDAKFAKQVQLDDGDERAKLLTEIQDTIVSDQVWSVLYQINTLLVMAESLGGYRLHPHFWYLDAWVADLSGR
jgi:peptide/nickel transport system substrate-binding protein